MKEVYIKLQTINDVRKLVSVVEKYPFSVDLSEGRYLVDAKSLMGIFSLRPRYAKDFVTAKLFL